MSLAMTPQQVIAYVQERAPAYNLDPTAVLAVAQQEGLNHPGSAWSDPAPGDPGAFAVGPWSLNSAGEFSVTIAAQGSAQEASDWAWSPAGVEFVLARLSRVAGGLQGKEAIDAIVTKFERPREDRAAGEIAAAWATFQSWIGGVIAGIGGGGSGGGGSGGGSSSGSGGNGGSSGNNSSKFNASGLIVVSIGLLLLLIGVIIWQKDTIVKVATVAAAAG